MKSNTLAIALGSLLVGGVAVAAFQNNRERGNDAFVQRDGSTAMVGAADDGTIEQAAIPSQGRLDYADVVSVEPVTEREPRYAQVVDVEPVRETSTNSVPREVCEDVVVQERLPERDGNVGGTVAGAVIGGLVGNQVGGGNGKKVATAAGAVAGGLIGNRVDRRHVGGRVVERTDRQCRTVQDTQSSSKTVAYNVTYRNADGTTGTTRTESKPGDRISLGNQSNTVGYDVTYRYEGAERTIRMSERPGQRLPMVDGRAVTQLESDGDRG